MKGENWKKKILPVLDGKKMRKGRKVELEEVDGKFSKDWWSEAAEDGSIIADTRQYSLHPCQAEIKILSRVE